jgi:hypothetical protein
MTDDPTLQQMTSNIEFMLFFIAMTNECNRNQILLDELDRLRASSPAEEAEPVAWTNEAQLGFLKEPGYRVVPMAMWAFQHSAHPIALYATPARPQPVRSDNDMHYLAAIRLRLERLYEEHPESAILREQISDEVDWIDAAITGAPK